MLPTDKLNAKALRYRGSNLVAIRSGLVGH